MTAGGKKRLGEILAAKEYVTEARIVKLLARAAGSGKLLGELLREEGLVTGEVLRSALEEQRAGKGGGVHGFV